MGTFREYICGWISVVLDYYILYSRTLDEAFKKFDLQESMHFINESDEGVSVTIVLELVASSGSIIIELNPFIRNLKYCLEQQTK